MRSKYRNFDKKLELRFNKSKLYSLDSLKKSQIFEKDENHIQQIVPKTPIPGTATDFLDIWVAPAT